MAEVVTLSLAMRPVRVEIDDAELAAELRAETEGFVIDDVAEPWLTVRVRRSETVRQDVEEIVIERIGTGRFSFRGPYVKGSLRIGQVVEADAEGRDLQSLYQIFNLCLSLKLPAEGAVLVHADAVEWRGGAIAFFGPSGTGKSTAARHLLRRGARLVAADRTVVETSEGTSRVLALPRMNRKEDLPDRPYAVPLRGLVAPRRGAGVVLRRLSRIDAVRSLLQSVNFPSGTGQPVECAVSTVEKVLATAWIGELEYDKDREFHDHLPLSEGDSWARYEQTAS